MNGIDTALLKKVRRIQIRATKMVEDILAGQYHSVFKGHGIEFEEVREYMPGDDVRSIDWNVTARTGKPYIKKFVEERDLTVIFVVDVSSSGVFGSLQRAKSEMTAELCSVLAFSAIENSDRVGVILFSDRVEKYIPPKKGKKHVLRVTSELLSAGKRESDRRKTDVNAGLDALGKVIKKRAVVFFVSDFLADDFRARMSVMGRKHDLIAVRVFDPVEEELPDAGLVDFEDPETGDIVTVDTADSRLRLRYERERKERQSFLKKYFLSSGIDFLELSTEGDTMKELIRFFRMREKRIRHGAA